MHNFKIQPPFALLGALLIVTATTFAQASAPTKSAEEMAGPQHEIISLPGGECITVTYPFDDDRAPVTITRWDTHLKQKYTHPNIELNRDNYRSAVFSQGRLFLLCSNKQGAVNRFEVDPNTGALAGSPTPLFDLPGKEEDCTFLSGSAPGGTAHYLLAQGRAKHEKGASFQGVILDQQGNKITSFSFTTPEDRDDVDHVDVVQNGKEGLFLLYEVNQKTAKDNFTPHAYTLVTVDATGKTGSFALNGLPAGDLRNLSWTLLNDRLAFTGLLAPAKKGGFRSVCSGTVDPVQKKVTEVRTTDLPALMSQATDPYKGWVSENANLVKTIPQADGSRTLLLEVGADTYLQSHYAPTPNPNNAALANGTLASYSITYLERNYVYLLKVDRNNTPQWLDVITKKQSEADLVVSIGTAAGMDAKGNIHLFFIDNKDNTAVVAQADKSILPTDGWQYKKNSLACITIAPDGTAKKQFVEDQDPEFRPVWTKAIPIADNDICFVAIKVKKGIGVERSLNHSHFRLGTISIK
jgi:hypothetical protein